MRSEGETHKGTCVCLGGTERGGPSVTGGVASLGIKLSICGQVCVTFLAGLGPTRGLLR